MKVAKVDSFCLYPKQNIVVSNKFERKNYSPEFTGYNSAMRYANRNRLINRIFKRKLYQTNLEKFEGIQEGLKSFEGLSMRQIAFAFTDLHSINMINGCNNHCLHCYANAQPFIKRYPFEDFKQICEDLIQLKKRTGTDIVHHRGEPYVDLFFDSDVLDCHLFDSQGKKYDYIDLTKMLHEATGYKSVFDTNGWQRKNTKKQKIAEDYVQKLLQDDNYKNFYQINVSINPFNPRYVRALNYNFPTRKLYSPLKLVGDEYIQAENKLSPEYKKARALYTEYVEDVANTLYTFSPLVKTNNFSVIIRTLSDKICEMKGYRAKDFSATLNHIAEALYFKYYMSGKIDLETYKILESKLSTLSTKMFTSGRMEKFYRVKNKDSFDKIGRIDSDRLSSFAKFEKIKANSKTSVSKMAYLKIISADGRVYMYDNYRLIPTDVRLNTSVDIIEKPFQIPVEDFVVTENMMDVI